MYLPLVALVLEVLLITAIPFGKSIFQYDGLEKIIVQLWFLVHLPVSLLSLGKQSLFLMWGAGTLWTMGIALWIGKALDKNEPNHSASRWLPERLGNLLARSKALTLFVMVFLGILFLLKTLKFSHVFWRDNAVYGELFKWMIQRKDVVLAFLIALPFAWLVVAVDFKRQRTWTEIFRMVRPYLHHPLWSFLVAIPTAMFDTKLYFFLKDLAVRPRGWDHAYDGIFYYPFYFLWLGLHGPVSYLCFSVSYSIPFFPKGQLLSAPQWSWAVMLLDLLYLFAITQVLLWGRSEYKKSSKGSESESAAESLSHRG